MSNVVNIRTGMSNIMDTPPGNPINIAYYLCGISDYTLTYKKLNMVMLSLYLRWSRTHSRPMFHGSFRTSEYGYLVVHPALEKTFRRYKGTSNRIIKEYSFQFWMMKFSPIYHDNYEINSHIKSFINENIDIIEDFGEHLYSKLSSSILYTLNIRGAIDREITFSDMKKAYLKMIGASPYSSRQ